MNVSANIQDRRLIFLEKILYTKEHLVYNSYDPLVCRLFYKKNIFGSGAFSGKMFLVRIVENDKIDAYFRAC